MVTVGGKGSTPPDAGDDAKAEAAKRIEADVRAWYHRGGRAFSISDKGAKVVLLAHFGRPKDGPSPEFSLEPVAKAAAKIIGRPIGFATDCVGEKAEEAVGKMKDGDILLLENTRFHKAEEKNDPAFTRKLAANGDIFVADGHSRNKSNSARIVKYSPDGTFIRAWGRMGSEPGNFREPHDLYVGGSKGYSKTTELPVENAFGPYLEERVIEVPKNKFARWDQQPTVGERVPIPQPDGSPIDVIVTEVTESKVTVDFNHPFAGQDLTIDIKLLDII